MMKGASVRSGAVMARHAAKSIVPFSHLQTAGAPTAARSRFSPSLSDRPRVWIHQLGLKDRRGSPHLCRADRSPRAMELPTSIFPLGTCQLHRLHTDEGKVRAPCNLPRPATPRADSLSRTTRCPLRPPVPFVVRAIHPRLHPSPSDLPAIPTPRFPFPSQMFIMSEVATIIVLEETPLALRQGHPLRSLPAHAHHRSRRHPPSRRPRRAQRILRRRLRRRDPSTPLRGPRVSRRPSPIRARRPLQDAPHRSSRPSEAARMLRSGRADDALPVALDVVEQAQDLHRPSPNVHLFEPYLLAARANLAVGRLKQTEDFLALASWLLLRDEAAATLERRARLARAFGKLRSAQGRHEDALRCFAEDAFHCAEAHGPESTHCAAGMAELAAEFRREGRTAEAAATARATVDAWFEAAAARPRSARPSRRPSRRNRSRRRRESNSRTRPRSSRIGRTRSSRVGATYAKEATTAPSPTRTPRSRRGWCVRWRRRAERIDDAREGTRGGGGGGVSRVGDGSESAGARARRRSWGWRDDEGIEGIEWRQVWFSHSP